jgi:hypothetical protein
LIPAAVVRLETLGNPVQGRFERYRGKIAKIQQVRDKGIEL